MNPSEQSLFRLIYRSRQTFPVAANLDHFVRNIIRSAVPNNRGDDLTGLLITIQGHFIQALEGPVDAVRTTYAKISMDLRHHDPHIISQGPVGQRLFSDWNMCARALAPSDQAILDVIDAKGDFNPDRLTPQSAERLLTTVADIQRRVSLDPSSGMAPAKAPQRIA